MVRLGSHTLAWLASISALGVASAAVVGAPATPFATVIQLNGAIGPAMSHYIEGALADATAEQARAVILEMDTPGGLDTAMRDIIKTILASPLPVIGYVAPSGARAASAGTYILYACTFAAMAPATNLGAATPIEIGGNEPPETTPTPPSSSPPGERAAPTPATASERKAVNDAVAYIRSLAQLHGRNADWAERAVRGAASLPAEEALQGHVVDFVATDVPDLLRQLDGRRAQVGRRMLTLQTAGLSVRLVRPDWRTSLLLVLSHPTIAYGLLLAGIWGLLLEGLHPGGVLPGVVGALALVLGLYGLELIAVNFAGLALMGLGVGLIVTEFFMPTYGSLGVGGLTAFVIGSIILFGHGAGAWQVAWPLIAAVALAGAVVIAAIASLAARARRRPVATGAEAMVGKTVEVVSAHGGRCVVRYGGELWNAETSQPLHPGQSVHIVRIVGLTLRVEPPAGSLSE